MVRLYTKIALALCVAGRGAGAALVDDDAVLLQSSISRDDPQALDEIEVDDEDEVDAEGTAKCGKSETVLAPMNGGYLYYSSDLKLGKGQKNKYKTVVWGTGSDQFLTTPIVKSGKYEFLKEEDLQYYSGAAIKTTQGKDKAKICDCKLKDVVFNEMVCEDKENCALFSASKYAEALIGLGPRVGETEHPYLEGRKSRISFCFPRTAEEDGRMIMGDDRPSDDEYYTIPVVGGTQAHHWSLNVTGVALKFPDESEKVPVAEWQRNQVAEEADKYWVAVPDTASGVLQVPEKVLNQIKKKLGAEVDEDNLVDCENAKLPTIVFQLHGQDFELPPSAYLAQSDGVEDAKMFNYGIANVRNQLAFPPNAEMLASKGKCALLFGVPAPYPGVFVLGLPFMRQYSPVFDYKKRVVSFKKEFGGSCDNKEKHDKALRFNMV